MKTSQLTLRLPPEVNRALDARATRAGVTKSQVVREALQAYLVAPPEHTAGAVFERVAGMVGSVALEHAAVERDAIASRIRAHNWRK